MSDEKKRNGAEAPGGTTRRSFLTVLSGGALAAYAAGTGGASLVFLKPRVTYGPPSKVVVGRPDAFTSGNQVALPEAKLVIRRQGNRYLRHQHGLHPPRLHGEPHRDRVRLPLPRQPVRRAWRRHRRPRPQGRWPGTR